MSRFLNIPGLLAGFLMVVSSSYAADISSGPDELLSVMRAQANGLDTVSDNAAAVALFATKIGPSLGLQDVSSTVTAKGIPGKMAKELGVPELTSATHRFIASLAAWHLADRTVQTLSGDPTLPVPTVPAQREWLQSTIPLPAWSSYADRKPDDGDLKALSAAANQLALEAHQQALTEWWALKTWKDRVRATRGRTRLCGTWQWVIHNHQNHQEQKVSMLFPPIGQEKTVPYLPAEMQVLGDAIYLRWETQGRVQEDSLLFIKDGTRIEGSFINNTGGWGSITGKRTSDCRP